MLKPIELRDVNNGIAHTGEIDVVDAYPDIIQWNHVSYVVKAIYKGSGLGSYRQATVVDLDAPKVPPEPTVVDESAPPAPSEPMAEGMG